MCLKYTQIKFVLHAPPRKLHMRMVPVVPLYATAEANASRYSRV